MANKYLENETFSFEKLIRLYENNPEISKIVIQRTKDGMNWKRNKDIIYISTDKSDDEILSIVSGSTKVDFEEQEEVKEDTEEKEEYIMDPDIEEFLNSYADTSRNEPKREIKKTASKKKQRFTFKKVKISINELLDKLEVLKEKDPEKFEKISSDLKEKIKEAIGKGKVYIALGLAALTLILAGVGIGINIDKPDKESTNPNQYEERINTKGTTFETQVEEVTQEEQNKIDTVAEVKEDFIKDYLEAYNKAYGTEYTEAELIVTNLRGTTIYQLPDGRKVTKGESPYKTQEVLNELGGFETIRMESDVIQIVSSDGTILGTYNTTTEEFMYSGNQSRDLQNEEFVEATLERLGIKSGKLRAAAQVGLAKGVESSGSINDRIATYAEIDSGR